MGLFLRHLVAILMIAGCLGETPSASAASDATARQIIDLHLQARGGREAIEALESLRRTAHERLGRNEYRLEWTWTRDSGVREDRHRHHLGRDYHRLRARNGMMIWGHDLTPERTRPGLLKADESAEFEWNSVLFVEPWRPFLLGDPYGYVFHYLGTGKARDRPAYLVQMTHGKDPSVEYAFDQKTFLLLRVRYSTTFAGQTTQANGYPTGATRLGGVLFETGYDFEVGGKRFRKVRFAQNAVNESVDPTFFRKPYVRPRTFGQ